MPLYVKFWGVRGSIPTPGHKTYRYGGNTSCVEMRADENVLICDAGTGIRELGADLFKRHGKAPMNLHMFFSHPHWDHIQGFPFFGPAYVPTNTLNVFGGNKGDRKIYDLLSGQMESAYFPVKFSEVPSTINANDLGGDRTAVVAKVEVTSFNQHHPGGSLGYIFRYGNAKVVYATDNELDQLLLDPKSVAKDPGKLREVPPEMVRNFQDADLLICDGQYTDDEYNQKIGWGHPRATTVVDVAMAANVKQLAIYHHDPMQSDHDVEMKVAVCKERVKRFKGKLNVFAAREGMELKFD